MIDASPGAGIDLYPNQLRTGSRKVRTRLSRATSAASAGNRRNRGLRASG